MAYNLSMFFLRLDSNSTIETLKTLIERGANVNASGVGQKTALHRAAAFGSYSNS